MGKVLLLANTGELVKSFRRILLAHEEVRLEMGRAVQMVVGAMAFTILDVAMTHAPLAACHEAMVVLAKYK